MSPTTAHDAATTNGCPPIKDTISDGDLPLEAAALIVARAKDILAGRLVPPPIPVPPAFWAHVEKEFGHRVPPPDPAVMLGFGERLGLEVIYQGAVYVVTCQAADGHLAVLAAGEPEIKAVLDALTDEEIGRILVQDTCAW